MVMRNMKRLVSTVGGVFLFTAAVSGWAQEEAPAAKPAQERAAAAPQAGGAVCGGARFGWVLRFGRGPGFVDANGNGVCDRLEQGLPPAGQGRGFCGRGGGRGGGGWGRCGGRGPGFVDANGNGVCDRLEQGLPPAGRQARRGPAAPAQK
jgi:hypothetical protein